MLSRILGGRQAPHSACLGLLALASASPAVTLAASEPVALLLAQDMSPGQSPAGYLVSEKYDGVRALWDGHRLRFRGGGEVAAPAWFLASLPALPLDGELWLGRGRFDEVSALVRREQADDSAWRKLRYMVFEAPGMAGSFADRVAGLKALAGSPAGATWEVVAQQAVADGPALARRLAEVVAAGGEGLALHRADAPYVTGRSAVLLKLKPVQDADAVVIGHQPGHGRFEGQLGALQVRNAAGQVFLIGSGLTDAQRRQPPPLGTTVSYRWRGHTATGLPRFATLWRVREPGV
jgi:DNA ligase-1